MLFACLATLFSFGWSRPRPPPFWKKHPVENWKHSELSFFVSSPWCSKNRQSYAAFRAFFNSVSNRSISSTSPMGTWNWKISTLANVNISSYCPVQRSQHKRKSDELGYFFHEFYPSNNCDSTNSWNFLGRSWIFMSNLIALRKVWALWETHQNAQLMKVVEMVFVGFFGISSILAV